MFACFALCAMRFYGNARGGRDSTRPPFFIRFFRFPRFPRKENLNPQLNSSTSSSPIPREKNKPPSFLPSASNQNSARPSFPPFLPSALPSSDAHLPLPPLRQTTPLHHVQPSPLPLPRAHLPNPRRLTFERGRRGQSALFGCWDVSCLPSFSPLFGS